MYWLARIAAAKAILRGLDTTDLDPDPIVQFHRWYRTARRVRIPQPNAMALATATPAGLPSVRFVLMKQVDDRGVVFFTNYQSRKGQELDAHPEAALVLYWPGLERQIRFEGPVERVPREESEAYFAHRPRGSQLGAWASRQSEPAGSREDMNKALEDAVRTYRGRSVPCPPHWGGYRLQPRLVEVWQGRAARLHDRFVYRREQETWRLSRLYP